MLTESFTLTITSPLGKAYSGQAICLTLQSDDGEIQILPGHTGLLSTFTASRLEIFEQQKRQEFILHQGLIKVSQDGTKVEIAAMAAEPVESVRIESLEEYIKFVEKSMENRESLSGFQIRYLEDSLESNKKMIEIVRSLDK